MAERMFDAESNTLAECFGDAWEQMPSDRAIEPGHAFEWAWLLGRLRDLGGGDFASVEDALRAKADQIGVYKRLVVDEVSLDGALLMRSSRLWPNTERLKAHAAHFERSGDEQAAAFACDAVDAVWLYRNPRIAALCRDRAGIDGGWVDTGAPSSSVYHMMLAFSELFRVTGVSAGSDAFQ
jgi:N-acylglucosamine 2-epimerase/mannose-6-phosphate isomerase